jgi:hypothetical protein
MVDVAGGGAAGATYRRVDIAYRTEPLLARRKLQKPVSPCIRSVYRRHDVAVLLHSPERDQPCFSDVYENTLDAGEEQFAIGRTVEHTVVVTASPPRAQIFRSLWGWSVRQGRSLNHASWSSFARAHPSIKIFWEGRGAFAGDFCTLAAFVAI